MHVSESLVCVCVLVIVFSCVCVRDCISYDHTHSQGIEYQFQLLQTPIIREPFCETMTSFCDDVRTGFQSKDWFDPLGRCATSLSPSLKITCPLHNTSRYRVCMCESACEHHDACVRVCVCVLVCV